MKVLDSTIRDFLDLPAYARLATLMPDGSPQLTVLWYRREDDALHIVCPQSTQKVVNLSADNRVSIVVEDPETSQRFVELRGIADVVRDDTRARQELTMIARRYIGADAESFVAQLSKAPRVLLIIQPQRSIRRGV